MTFQLRSNPDRDATMRSAREFCRDFCREDAHPKYVLGRNIYAASVAESVAVTAFVDDFTNEKEYLGRPIVKLSDVPGNAIVLNVAGGRPLSARGRLDEARLRNLDYFAFYKYSGLPLLEMRFNEGFEQEFEAHKDRYAWIYGELADDISRDVFEKLVSFRFDYDLAHLSGFTWREDVQYFEDFLRLQKEGETFVDVGGFNGFTSLEFIRRCPKYGAVHVFEPEPANFRICVNNLEGRRDVYCHNAGLSNEKAVLKLDVQGSGSKISDSGSVSIEVVRLDDLAIDVPTFIKMDIEGAEASAIEGARETILVHHPRLAISVYHAPGDFWRIPEMILSMRNDYQVYMRHYTECIYETVMFFLPK